MSVGPLASRRLETGLFLLSAALIMGFGLCLRRPPIADEEIHIEQIRMLLRGQWALAPWLTTLPAYHVLVAGGAWLTGRTGVGALRLYSFALGIAALSTLFVIARRAGDGRAVERLLQIAFLPLLFPLLFLIYTDVAGILFLALGLLLHCERRYWLSATAGIIGIVVRQNNVVWFTFLATLLLVQIFRHDTMEVPPANADERSGAARAGGRSLVGTLSRQAAVYIAGVVLFGAFVLWNGGVAVGDRHMHPFPVVRVGNIYFVLLVAFFVFLPLHIANARTIARLCRRPSMVAMLAACLVVFMVMFVNDHPYNQADHAGWLHNRILGFLTSSAPIKMASFLPMAITLLSLAGTPLRDRSHYLVYPFTVLSLLPAWLIEPRYYLVPFILFVLFRRQASLQLEWLLIGYLALITAILFSGIRAGAYFL
jgi:alpha-1,2-glucosyltransferase